MNRAIEVLECDEVLLRKELAQAKRILDGCDESDSGYWKVRIDTLKSQHAEVLAALEVLKQG